MKRHILHIYDYMTTHKAVACCILLALLAIGLWRSGTLHYLEDISSFLPQNEDTRKYTGAFRRLGGDDKISLLFTGGDFDARREAMDQFEEKWTEGDSTGKYAGVLAKVNEDDILGVTDFIVSNLPYFLLPEDYSRMDSLLADRNYVKERIRNNKTALLNPGLSSGILRNDPIGLSGPVFQRLGKLRPDAGGVVEEGHLFSSDRETGILFLTSPYGGSESAQNAGLADYIDQIRRQTTASNPEIDILATGGPLVAVENARRIKKDSIWALVLAGLLITLLLWFSYKRLDDVLWILVSIAAGALFALTLISLFKSSISIIVLGIGSMIIGIAVNYPLHYIDHLKYQPDKRKALAEQVNPLLVGNLTTVGAFLSLILLKADAIKDFGFVGAMLLIGTIFFVLIFLPVFISPSQKPRNTLRLDADRFFRLSGKGRKAVFLLFLALTAFFYWGSREVTFNADLHQINYMTGEQSDGFKLLSAINGDNSGTETMYIISEGNDAETVLGQMEAISSRQPGIRSLADFLPSGQERKKRISDWTGFWDKHRETLDEIRSTARAEGFTDWAYAPFFEAVDKEWPAGGYDMFAPIYETVGQAMFLPDEGTVRAVGYLNVPLAEKENVRQDIQKCLGENDYCFFSSDLGGSLVGLLNQDFDKIGFLCSLIVFIFLWLSFSSLELCIISFIPLAVSWIWILGTMNLFGIGFNIINIILASFIFGQGDDYTIFMTEGLMYEYATGKKILRSYKNAVTLSALVMFIGIGVLILAKHPAMRSLAQVTIVGMITVVVMAYYLPPLLFRFLTTRKDGTPRRTPLTLRNIIETIYIFTVFILALGVVSIWCWMLFFFGKDSEKKRLNYHRLISSMAKMAINSIPGGNFTVNNTADEDFSEPAIYICNHQSHFDVLAILALHPKIIFLTNDWAWKFYGSIIRKAEFYPVSYGLEKNGRHIKNLVSRGYSVVIFPEGTRSEDCSIQRFHRGAFLAARELGIPILPLYIHGFGYALPKHDFVLRHSGLYLEIGRRFTVPEGDVAEITRKVRHQYLETYDRIRRERETASYVARFVRENYRYKGHEAQMECRRVLRPSTLAQVDRMTEKELLIPDAGYGVYALLVALSHPDMKVTAVVNEEDQYLTATRCQAVPENLVYLRKDEA